MQKKLWTRCWGDRRGELPKRSKQVSPLPFVSFLSLSLLKQKAGWEESYQKIPLIFCWYFFFYLYVFADSRTGVRGWGCWLHESDADALNDVSQGWSFPLSFVPGKGGGGRKIYRNPTEILHSPSPWLGVFPQHLLEPAPGDDCKTTPSFYAWIIRWNP